MPCELSAVLRRALKQAARSPWQVVSPAAKALCCCSRRCRSERWQEEDERLGLLEQGLATTPSAAAALEFGSPTRPSKGIEAALRRRSQQQQAPAQWRTPQCFYIGEEEEEQPSAAAEQASMGEEELWEPELVGIHKQLADALEEEHPTLSKSPVQLKASSPHATRSWSPSTNEVSPLSLTPMSPPLMLSPSPCRRRSRAPASPDPQKEALEERAPSGRRELLGSFTACATAVELDPEAVLLDADLPEHSLPDESLPDEELDDCSDNFDGSTWEGEDDAETEHFEDFVDAEVEFSELLRIVWQHAVVWPKKTKLDVEDHLSRAPDMDTFLFFDWRDRLARILVPSTASNMQPGCIDTGGSHLQSISEDAAPWRASLNSRSAARSTPRPAQAAPGRAALFEESAPWRAASRRFRVAARADRQRWHKGCTPTSTASQRRGSNSMPHWRPP
mmetsp:Transcript_40060/g.92974  ORF Transcript_40060/g.92974 Transcript_40060/m.92974 type:complete len:448 (-) Transcript_40060:76-1419(-)